MIKAIGRVRDDFVGRIVYAARLSLRRPRDVTHTTRVTPNGEHVAVTLNLTVLTADEVMTVYQALQAVEGLKFLI